jgi:phosphohistidine phosphatase
MIRVYLVRHAKAEKNAARDADRPLTPEGRARFAALAKALAPSLRPSAILTSPLVRARETAEILGAATGVAAQDDPALASGASTGRELLALARRAGEGAVLVGHNPEIEEALRLAGGAPGGKVSPGTIAAVDLDPGSARVAWARAP